MRRTKLDGIIAVSGKTAMVIAEAANIHYNTLAKIRGGAATTPGTMQSIAWALNKTPKQVFGKEYTGDK